MNIHSGESGITRRYPNSVLHEFQNNLKVNYQEKLVLQLKDFTYDLLIRGGFSSIFKMG